MTDDPTGPTASRRVRRPTAARIRGSSATATAACGSSERERLLAAIIEVTARDGYAATTTGALIAAAGVSRRSLYECFTGKEECLLTALKLAHEQLLADVRRAVLAEPGRGAQLAVESLVSFASSQPATARVVFGEAMAAGRAALDARDHAVDQIAQSIEAAYDSLDPDAAAPDISARMLIGGVCRLLAARLRQSGQIAPGLDGELIDWLRSYQQPLALHRWRTLRPIPLASPPAPTSTLHPSQPQRLECLDTSREGFAAHSRARIIAAVAQLAEQRGYAATTIADISRQAELSPRAFYRLFADKQEAFAALHEDHFRALMGVTAGAFFAQADWPARIWAAGRAFSRYLEQAPTLARTSFIESYAGDPVSLPRVEELVGAFTLFLQEGYQYRELEAPPTALALDAIATTIFELNYRYTRADRVHELAALIPHGTFISLAPFLGCEDANGFIEKQIGPSSGRVLIGG
jgi:AcrR family transcriptional regulator